MVTLVSNARRIYKVLSPRERPIVGIEFWRKVLLIRQSNNQGTN